MAINKVGTKGITDGAISAIDFADNTITSGKLVNSAITNALLSNSSITLGGTSIALGASASFTNKFVQWQSVITGAGSSSTAVAGKGYFINTTSAVHTINLPASASIGDFVAIKDYAGTFATYNLTIGRNGHNIQGVANNSLITTNRASLVLVYVDATKGWLYWEEHNVTYYGPTYISATGGTVATSGDYKIHSFTGDGCFTVSQVGNPAGGPSNVDYLVVAGGGGGGRDWAGGAGAGGYRESYCATTSGSYTASPLATPTSLPVSVTAYPIAVGGGGATCVNGANSIFSSITSAGGGSGGQGGGGGSPYAAGTGGSGGGAGSQPPACGAAGNTPPVSPPQGNPGGNRGPSNQSGGGGGAGQAGQNAPGPYGCAAKGGDGVATSIAGSPVTRAGGGGGGTYPGYGGPAPGGAGGGGAGNSSTSGGTGTAGTSNTGGGGGGGAGGCGLGAAGGSGIVIIRYKFQ